MLVVKKKLENSRFSSGFDLFFSFAGSGSLKSPMASLSVNLGSMGSGKMIYSNNFEEKGWYYPSPNTIGESQLKAVCNHKSMQ